jgi:hypothetical protein
MTYKTLKQVQNMLKDGQGDEAYRIVRRYGVIVGRHEWGEAEGHYKGANLAIDISYRDLVFSFELLNGSVIAADWK